MEFEVPARVAVLVGPRGRGSNMLALIEAAERGEIEASIDVVIAPVEDAPALSLRVRGG